MRLAVLLAMVSMGCSTSDIDILPDSGDTPGESGWYDSTPRCPPEVVRTSPAGGGMTDYGPQYPMTYVEVITGADAVSTMPFAARWTGIRRLATPITRSCLDAFVTDPPGIPCQVDTVIELTMTDDTLVEILVGLAFEDLEPFADGRTVSVLLGYDVGTAVPRPSPSRQLEIREGEAGPLLLAVESRADLYGGLAGWTWDDMTFDFDEILCAAERDSCLRVFVSRKLYVSILGAGAWLEPGDIVPMESRGHGYWITYRRGVERAYGVFPAECANLSLAMQCAEMVRMP